jgi:hypothetical protein
MRRLPLRLPRDNRGGKMSRKQFPRTAAHSHGCLIDLPSGRHRICDYYVVALRCIPKNRSLSLEDFRTFLFCHYHELCRSASRRIAHVALLKPMLQDPVSGIGLTEVNYGYIVTAFSLAYALGLLEVGGFIDVWHKNRLRGCSRGLDPGRRTGIAAACQSGNLSVITEGARLYVDIVREVQREATARMA